VAVEQTRNQVLAEFSRSNPEASSRFFRELEPVALERGAPLAVANGKAGFVYFVESGIVTLMASTPGGHSIGVAIVGYDGIVGIADALGEHPFPYGWIVQIAGSAYRVPIALVRHHIETCSELHSQLLGYSQLVMHQLAQSAVCNRFHTSVQRLSRWLLLTAARTETDRFEVTHEFIAQMLGAPRSAVTQAAASLRRRHIIDYRRGVLTIRDAKRLHGTSCECADIITNVTGVN
jgi:CRP-like cAMP-binding protein